MRIRAALSAAVAVAGLVSAGLVSAGCGAPAAVSGPPAGTFPGVGAHPGVGAIAPGSGGDGSTGASILATVTAVRAAPPVGALPGPAVPSAPAPPGLAAPGGSAGAIPPGPAWAGSSGILVTGTGTVSGTPDTLTIQLGVQTQATTAESALRGNDSAATAVIGTLRAAGVAQSDLRTSGLSIYPTYTSDGTGISGYQVSNLITATLHGIAKAGPVIDAAQHAAGDAIRVDSVGFSFADDSALLARARADAVKKALAQAKQLADAAGVHLGAVLSITENTPYALPGPVYATAGSAAGAGAPTMPVLPGSQEVTVTVQVLVGIAG